MPQVSEICRVLERIAPVALAESWDNVGLLLGDESAAVSRVVTCLTLTEDVAAEAIGRKAELIASHHPVLFRPVQRLTSRDPQGRMLLQLVSAGCAVYSPHTSYDNSAAGINQQLAELFDLQAITPLRPQADDAGAGRCGTLPREVTLAELNATIKERLGIAHLQFVGDQALSIRRLGIACGSAAEFIPDATAQDCQALFTGEARFHDCLKSRDAGLALILPGHYASERPGVERLAGLLAAEFPGLDIWASEAERDPVQWD